MKNRIAIWYILLAGILVSGTTNAQDEGPKSFSLEEAIQYAIANNYTLKNTALDVGLSKNKIKETTAIGLPQINAEINYQNFIDIPTQVMSANAFNPLASEDLLIPVQFGTNNNAYAKITANQLLFDGAYIVGLQAAKVYLQLSMQNLAKGEIEIRDLVSRTYYMVLIAQENEKILTQNVENLKNLLSETRMLNNNGFVDDIEVEQLELTVSNLLNALTKVKGQIITTCRLLNFQMGINVDELISLRDNLEDLLSNINREALIKKELEVENHIDYKLLMTRETLMKLNLKKEKFVRMPTLGAFATHSQNTFSNNLDFPDWYPTTIWGINMSIPIFDSFGQSSRIRQAKLELQKVQNQRVQMDQNLRMLAGNAQVEFNTAYAQSNIEEKNMKLALKILNKTLTMHKEGLASSAQVTQANNQYLTTQGNYYNSIFELLKSKSNLDKALNNYEKNSNE
ncbi:TolC family protein [Candidatus Amoebophilus asiaticus]|nr:TolC family protein [Candidatus Amoebophilus asiaticus]